MGHQYDFYHYTGPGTIGPHPECFSELNFGVNKDMFTCVADCAPTEFMADVSDSRSVCPSLNITDYYTAQMMWGDMFGYACVQPLSIISLCAGFDTHSFQFDPQAATQIFSATLITFLISSFLQWLVLATSGPKKKGCFQRCKQCCGRFISYPVLLGAGVMIIGLAVAIFILWADQYTIYSWLASFISGLLFFDPLKIFAIYIFSGLVTGKQTFEQKEIKRLSTLKLQAVTVTGTEAV
eukprot:TRINITY_DN8976_c1_g1_i2.p1 TRINITY_DN8976_c1_g1~~TRINITY_DN8976_c1_g1_i2.p1  ORF type:complete len:238 (+),score=46.95 TRINITY_DN8976_c1_g1_i2:701-1414(+)